MSVLTLVACPDTAIETVRTVVNLELATTGEILDLACALGPMQATLVPEGRQEITTEGGLALATAQQRAEVGRAVDRLRGAGIRTSLFIAPDLDAVAASSELGVDAIELHTGEYAHASAGDGRAGQLLRLSDLPLQAERAYYLRCPDWKADLPPVRRFSEWLRAESAGAA